MFRNCRKPLSQREGGDPERFNGNSLAAMDGTGPMGDAIVLLLYFRGVPCRHHPVGFDEQDILRCIVVLLRFIRFITSCKNSTTRWQLGYN